MELKSQARRQIKRNKRAAMKIADSPNYSRKGRWWKAAGSSWFERIISKLFVSRNRFKMKGNCALCVEVTTGIGSSLKEPAAAVSCGRKILDSDSKDKSALHSALLQPNSTSELPIMQIWNQRNSGWNSQVKPLGTCRSAAQTPRNVGFYHQEKGNFTKQGPVKKIMIMTGTRKMLLKSVPNKDGIYALSLCKIRLERFTQLLIRKT